MFEEINGNNFYDIYKRPRKFGPPFVLGLRKNGEAESVLYRGKKQAKFSEFCFLTQLIYNQAYTGQKRTEKICGRLRPVSDETDKGTNHLYSTCTKRLVSTVTKREPVKSRKLRAAYYSYNNTKQSTLYTLENRQIKI